MTTLRSRVPDTDELDALRARNRELEDRAKSLYTLVSTLYYWTGSMSYNDSYVGEPPGFIKGVVRQMAHEVDKI